jgi:hypothetical protein
MHTDRHRHTHSHTYTLAEVGDMEDVRPVSGVRVGDGQAIAIGDMEEIGYVSGIMRVFFGGRDARWGIWGFSGGGGEAPAFPSTVKMTR